MVPIVLLDFFQYSNSIGSLECNQESFFCVLEVKRVVQNWLVCIATYTGRDCSKCRHCIQKISSKVQSIFFLHIIYFVVCFNISLYLFVLCNFFFNKSSIANWVVVFEPYTKTFVINFFLLNLSFPRTLILNNKRCTKEMKKPVFRISINFGRHNWGVQHHSIGIIHNFYCTYFIWNTYNLYSKWKR